MRAILMLALAAGAGWAQAPNRPEAPAAAGMILDAPQGGFVERGNQRIPLALGELVYVGDRLLTGSAPATLLFCPTSERITLDANTRADVRRDALAVRKGPVPRTVKVRQCALPRVALGTESLERVGGLRARGHPPIALYMGGPVRTSRPVFEWSPIQGADSYRVLVRTGAGGEVWETEVRAPRAEYPGASPDLSPGKYEWEVRALAAGKTIALQVAGFEMRPATTLHPDVVDGADRLVAATVLENAGYYAEAAAQYRALRERSPDDARLTRRLAWLYWTAGLVVAADEEVKKVRK